MARHEEIIHASNGRVYSTPDGGSQVELDIREASVKGEVDLADATGSKSRGHRSYKPGLKKGTVSCNVILRKDEDPIEGGAGLDLGALVTLKLENDFGGGYWQGDAWVASFDWPIRGENDVVMIPFEFTFEGEFTYHAS